MKAIRFRPPEIESTPELRWVLHRAFARDDLPVAPPRDPETAFDFARRLHLASRIAARAAPGRLPEEVGASAEDFAREHHLAVGNGLRYRATIQHVAELAAARRIPIIVLKGAALALLGLGTPGARNFSDLDVLIPLGRIHELRSALVASGWHISPAPRSEHQEAPLTHPALGMTELHRRIPGVRPPGFRHSFDADVLLDAGLTDEVPGFDTTCRVPKRSILIAHALVHSIVQHGFAPDGYPLFRLVVDLQSLRADLALLREAGRFLRDFDLPDLHAIATLCGALESGTAAELPNGPARVLLRHLVLAHLSPRYALGLKSHPNALLGPSDLPIPLARLRWALKVTFLSRAQVDQIYGPQKTWIAYAARQLVRPFDLGLRFLRSLQARRE